MLTHNKTICSALWTHLSIEPNSMVYTCCMATSSPPLGKLDPKDPESLKKIWNGDVLKQFRLSMMKGEKLEQCKPCYNLEGHGEFSQRLYLNDRFKDSLPNLIKQTKADGSLEALPRFFGLRFSNICNYACRICDSQLSTSWYGDDIKLGKKPPAGPIKIFEDIKQVGAFFAPYINSLEWVYFAGGEPFISLEHHDFIHFLRRSNKFDIKLLYNTNLSLLESGGVKMFDLWSGFQSIILNVSLDAINDRGEYLRYGQNWKKTVELINQIKASSLPIKIIYAPVVSVHNLFHLPEYIDYFLDHHSASANDFVFDPMTSPNYFSVKVLPKDLKAKAKSELIKFQKKLIIKLGMEASSTLVKQIYGLINFMESEDHSYLWELFIKKTVEVDKIRNQNISVYFREFEEKFATGVKSGGTSRT